ncbi:uncharacterized protein LOC144453066 isoform X2 [Glandiceps talaboti]
MAEIQIVIFGFLLMLSSAGALQCYVCETNRGVTAQQCRCQFAQYGRIETCGGATPACLDFGSSIGVQIFYRRCGNSSDFYCSNMCTDGAPFCTGCCHADLCNTNLLSGLYSDDGEACRDSGVSMFVYGLSIVTVSFIVAVFIPIL